MPPALTNRSNHSCTQGPEKVETDRGTCPPSDETGSGSSGSSDASTPPASPKAVAVDASTPAEDLQARPTAETLAELLESTDWVRRARDRYEPQGLINPGNLCFASATTQVGIRVLEACVA